MLKVEQDLTPAQIELLKNRYPYESNKSLGEVLGVSATRVRNWARELELEKDRGSLSRRISRAASQSQANLRAERYSSSPQP